MEGDDSAEAQQQEQRELEQNDEERQRMRAELEAYVASLEQRSVASFPDEQVMGALSEAPSDFWGRCLLDARFAETASKDPRVAQGLRQVCALDIELAKKTRELRELRRRKKKKIQQEQSVATEDALPSTPPKATTERDAAEDDSAYGGMQETQLSRLQAIDQRLQEFAAGAMQALHLPPGGADPGASAATAVQLGEVCRAVAEARWAADHPGGNAGPTRADVDARTEEILADVLGRVQGADTPRTTADRAERRRQLAEEDKECETASELPQLQQEKARPQSSPSTVASAASASAGGDQPTPQQQQQVATETILPRLPPAPERVHSTGGHGRPPPAGSAPSTVRTYSPASGSSRL